MASDLKYKEDCAVCGTPLVYGTETVPMRCSFCNEIFEAQIYCPQGHYVCDAYHWRDAADMLKNSLVNSTFADPIELLEILIAHPLPEINSSDDLISRQSQITVNRQRLAFSKFTRGKK